MTIKRQQEEKRLFKRLVSAHFDLAHAKCCATQILDRKLHESERENDYQLLRCLNTALIVSYWRPFSANEATPDEIGTLPDRFRSTFTATERRIHNRVREARNSEHAHSDPRARSTRVSVRQIGTSQIAIPMSRDVFIPLPMEAIVQLQGMIDKLLAQIAEETVRIQRTLKPDTSF